jgi:hypothetical protein
MPERTVRRVIVELSEQGLVEKVERRRRDDGTLGTWVLHLPVSSGHPWTVVQRPSGVRTSGHPWPDRTEERTGREETKVSSRQPDVLWDRLVQIIGEEPTTKSERGRWNHALKEMRDAGATPDQLTAVALAYRKTWPEMTLTPTALVANWTVLTANGTTTKELRATALQARMEAHGSHQESVE